MRKKMMAALENIGAYCLEYQDLSLSLMEGAPGIILFLDQYYAFAGNPACCERRNYLLRGLIEGIDQSDQLSLTYCDGLAGFLAFMCILKENDYYDFDEDLDEYLNGVMVENLLQGKFDILHGPLGILWYFIIRLRTRTGSEAGRRNIRQYLKNGLALLEDTAVKDAMGYRWKSSMALNEHFMNKEVYNMGFAHGQPGVLAIASFACDLLPGDTVPERMIKELGRFIASRADLRSPVQFQAYYSPDAEFAYDSRLAWCYGDLSAAFAIHLAAQRLKDNTLAQLGEDIAIRSAQRTTPGQTSIFDAELCHGAMGVSHLYGIFYERTNNPVYRTAQVHWIDHALSLSCNPHGIAGFRTHIREDEWGRDAGLLKGVAGIGLGMLSFLGQPRNWDSLLILS